MDKTIELTLPEFAFMESGGHEKDVILSGRNVIIHVRSASVAEVFDWEDVALNQGVLAYRFTYTNIHGIRERKVIALHYSATLDIKSDRQMIIEEVLIPASKWFCDYLDWEDKQDNTSNNILAYGIN